MKMEYDKVLPPIFEEATIGILVVDRTGTIIHSNPFCNKLFGYLEGGMKGMKIEDLVPRNYRGQHSDYRNKYLKNPKPRIMGAHRELYGLKKNGSEFPVEISLSSTEIGGDKFALAYVTDDTNRKKILLELEDSRGQLLQLNEKLEEKVEQRTKELEDTINRLLKTNKTLEEREIQLEEALNKEKELNELKSRFVSMASHEFRTPLSTILSSSSLISKYETKEQQGKRLKHTDRIKSSVRNLTNILNEFLSLSKIEEGKEIVEISEINIKEFCHSVLDELKGIKKKGQKIIYENESGLEVIYSDGRILKNILFNLMSNAIKYSPEGKNVYCRIRKTEKGMSVEIIDQGIGIPEKEQKHLFSRFFRASNVENIKGTGLGLNIVKRYVELLGGDIGFTSKGREGTVFSLSLPDLHSSL